MNAILKLAKEVANDKIIHIDEVVKNHNSIFKCAECHQILLAVKSEQRLKDWHFRHLVGKETLKCRSTALHDFAIQTIIENRIILLRLGNFLKYENPKKEARVGNYRSDVVVSHNGEEIHFEIFVTHDLTLEKIQFYKTKNIRCIKIDLSDQKFLTASQDDLKYYILNSSDTKTYVYWPESITNSPSDSFLKAGIILVTIYLFKVFFRNSTKSPIKRKYPSKFHRRY